MAPLPPTKHSRTVRSAKNPRGIYAPPPSTTLSATASTNYDPPLGTHDADISADRAFAAFKLNKQDERSIRHQTLLSKVRESGVRKGRSGGLVQKRRRRPGRKLVADVGGLGDALPDIEPNVEVGGRGVGGVRGGDDGEGEGEWEGLEDDDAGAGDAMAGTEGLRKAKRRRRTDGGGGGARKMVMKTLPSRPGAMERKREMELRERERFGRNLAQMVGRREQDVRRTAAVVGVGGGAGAGEVDGDGRVGGGQVGASQGDRWAALRGFIGGTMERSEAFGKG